MQHPEVNPGELQVLGIWGCLQHAQHVWVGGGVCLDRMMATFWTWVGNCKSPCGNRGFGGITGKPANVQLAYSNLRSEYAVLTGAAFHLLEAGSRSVA